MSLSQGEGKLLYSCADLEGHIGEDGRMYCIGKNQTKIIPKMFASQKKITDFSRCFPPVAIEPSQKLKNAHLFRTFRPEFVRHYPIPLCPDTYSGYFLIFLKIVIRN